MKPRSFSYLAWFVAIGLAPLLFIATCTVFVDNLDLLYEENGPMEDMSLALWIMSAVAAAVTVWRRWTNPTDRLVAFWIASLSCLAALREADAHLLLKPEQFGRFGFHFRLSWVFDPLTGVVPRLFFLGVVILIAALIMAPPLRLRARFWKLLRGKDLWISLLVVSVVGLALGVCMDDLLRDTTLMPKDVRKLTEETCEFWGALAFFAGSLLLLKSPFSERLAAVEKQDQPV